MRREELNALSNQIIGLAIEVHRELGPSFDEKIYSRALEEEFLKADLRYDKERFIEVKYKNKKVGEHRVDFILEEDLIVELKAAEQIVDVHLAQLLSYLKAINKHLGLVLNFGAGRLGIRRVVNDF